MWLAIQQLVSLSRRRLRQDTRDVVMLDKPLGNTTCAINHP